MDVECGDKGGQHVNQRPEQEDDEQRPRPDGRTKEPPGQRAASLEQVVAPPERYGRVERECRGFGWACPGVAPR